MREVEFEYNPLCLECRRAAGRPDAGATGQCHAHTLSENADLRAEVERLRAEAATKLDACQREIARLRAFLPLIRESVRWYESGDHRTNVLATEMLGDVVDSMTPEQRAWLMEADK